MSALYEWGRTESAMNDDQEDPVRIVKLGDARFYIKRKHSGSYLLCASDGTPIAPPFTRADAERFARDLLTWFREAGARD